MSYRPLSTFLASAIQSHWPETKSLPYRSIICRSGWLTGLSGSHPVTVVSIPLSSPAPRRHIVALWPGISRPGSTATAVWLCRRTPGTSRILILGCHWLGPDDYRLLTGPHRRLSLIHWRLRLVHRLWCTVNGLLCRNPPRLLNNTPRVVRRRHRRWLLCCRNRHINHGLLSVFRRWIPLSDWQRWFCCFRLRFRLDNFVILTGTD